MFADVEEREKKSFQKTQFLNVNAGQNVIIRLLESKALKVYTHYLNKITVACLDSECPICANNSRLIVENPDDFRNAKGWSAQTRRYFVNVLDRTPVKICPKCQAENKRTNNKWSPTCFSCDTFLTDVAEQPSNKVKVFGFGVRVAEQFNALTVDPITGDIVDLLSFDLALVATGQGKEKEIKVITAKERNDVVEIPEESFYDLNNAVIHLHPDEMLQLQRGISLKDIFAARKADQESDVKEELSNLSEETKQEVADRLSKMFSN